MTVEPNALAASNPIFEGTPELDTKKPKPTVGMQTNESQFCQT